MTEPNLPTTDRTDIPNADIPSAESMTDTEPGPSRDRLAEMRRSLHALAGVGDLAVAQLRDLPEDISAEVRRLDTTLEGLPEQVRALVSRVGDTVGMRYAELVDRGERVLAARRASQSETGEQPAEQAGEQPG